MLAWQTADGSQGLGSALDYEVTYKRQWESWEVRAEELSCPGLGCTNLGSSKSVEKVVQMSGLSILQ